MELCVCGDVIVASRWCNIQKRSARIAPSLPSLSTTTYTVSQKYQPENFIILSFKMPRPTTRAEVLQRLRDTIASGRIILGAGAGKLSIPTLTLDFLTLGTGIGLSAKFIEAGGGDLIILYNSGRFRMAGRGSLAGLMPYGDANQVVLEMV